LKINNIYDIFRELSEAGRSKARRVFLLEESQECEKQGDFSEMKRKEKEKRKNRSEVPMSGRTAQSRETRADETGREKRLGGGTTPTTFCAKREAINKMGGGACVSRTGRREWQVLTTVQGKTGRNSTFTKGSFVMRREGAGSKERGNTFCGRGVMPEFIRDLTKKKYSDRLPQAARIPDKNRGVEEGGDRKGGGGCVDQGSRVRKSAKLNNKRKERKLTGGRPS